jgi:hypothetical protein
MSSSNLLRVNGKIDNSYLPNPYPFPASPANLGEVLFAGNTALSPVTGLPQDATDFKILGCETIFAGEVFQGNNPSIKIGDTGDNLQIKGGTALGSLLVGNGLNTEELVCPTTTTTDTTSDVYNWITLANGQSKSFGVSDGSLYQLGYSITITYSGTDSITGTITAVVGDTITITITSFTSLAYGSAPLITTTPPDPATATSGGGDPVFIFNGATTTPNPPDIPPNSFLLSGTCFLYAVPAQPPLNITLTAINVPSALVNATTSIFSIPVYELPPVSTTPFSWGSAGCYFPAGGQISLASNTGGNNIAFGWPTGGSFIDQNFAGTINGYSLAYSSGTISINSKLVLTADVTKPLGVFWGVDAQGVGTVTSVSGGNNISISGSLSAPVVNLQSPLTATLALGGVSMTAGANPATTSNSTINSTDVIFQSGGVAGGPIVAQYGQGGATLQSGTNQLQLSSAGITNADQSVGTQLVTNASTPQQVQVKSVNGITTGTQQATLTNQALQYVATDSLSVPTQTTTSTYDNCSRTAVALNNSTGATATRTEIIDDALQSRQQQTLVSPSANTTSTINCNCEIITSVPTAYFQLLTDNSSTLISTAFGATASDLQGEMSASFTNTTSGSEYQGLGGIICNGGGSSMTVSSANIAGASSHLLRLECPLVGDALIEHQVVGAGVRNLDITSTGSVQFTSTNIASTSTNFKLLNSATGGQANPLLTLTNTNATGSVAMEVYKDKPTAGANGDVLFTQSVYGKDSGNAKQEYTRITSTIRDATAGAEDGSLELGCFVNGAFANFIQLNANDAPIGEVNFVRPLDFIGGSDANSTIKTSGTGSVNLNLDATASAGTGHIVLKPKVAGGEVQISQPIATLSNPTGQLNISANTSMSVSCASNMTLTAPTSTNFTTPSLVFTGPALQSATSGGNSGQHLVITLNGVVYKIKLENP